MNIQWGTSLLNNLGLFDILLIAVVSLMVAGVAYLKQPYWKAFILLLPFPGTLAVLSIDKPVDISFLLGLPLMAFFYYMIYVLYNKLGMNIVLAIAISAITYCLISMAALPFLPDSPEIFLIVFCFLILYGIILNHSASNIKEEGYRTSLPIYVKAPMVMMVVFLLVEFKYSMSGFMAGFPMVGIVGAYEMRHCLKTVFSQIPLVFFAVGSMVTVCFLIQNIVGLYGELGLGWLVYIIVLLYLRKMWFPDHRKMHVTDY